MQKQSHDPTSVVQMATLTALAVRRRFRACGFIVDLDDVSQEAALYVVETMSKKKLDPSKNIRGYLYRTAALRAGLRASLSLAAVRIPNNLAARAREFQHRVQIAGCGPNRPSEHPVVLAGGDLPDARLERAALARRRAAALVVLRRRLDQHLAGFERRERLAIEICLGWEGDSLDPDAAAWLTGLSKRGLAGVVRRLGRKVRSDARAQDARRVIRETTEDR